MSKLNKIGLSLVVGGVVAVSSANAKSLDMIDNNYGSSFVSTSKMNTLTTYDRNAIFGNESVQVDLLSQDQMANTNGQFLFKFLFGAGAYAACNGNFWCTAGLGLLGAAL